MTKEERAKKWFLKIPDAEYIRMETKMNICSKVAKKMAVIFFILLALECVLIFILSGGEVFNFIANFLNNISAGRATRNHYRGVALIGGIVCLSIIIIPLIVALTYKNNGIKSEIAKATKVVSKGV